MKSFKFTREKSAIVNLIANANEFIKIITFQFTDEKFIREFILPKSKKVKIEIITLPEDSYSRPDERARIIDLYQDLEANGIIIHRCSWEIGEPSLSNSSQSGESNQGGGTKWYSMHGKLIFSEHEALMMTSNFTNSLELESYLLFDEDSIIHEFNEKFNLLKSYFINPLKYPGNIYELIDESTKLYIDSAYSDTKRLRILDYPLSMLPRDINVKGLKITPFEGKARDYLYKMIDESDKYLFLSSERLFDEDLVTKLIRKKQTTNIDIQLITSPFTQVRDNHEKAEKMIFDLLTYNIKVRIFNDIHAKCWISENVLAIGSINLGQMNLGINKSPKRWRANTEIMYFENDPDILASGRAEFEKVFITGTEPIKYISSTNKAIEQAKSLFKTYNASSRDDAKVLISLIVNSNKILSLQECTYKINKIVEIAVKLKQMRKHRYVEKSDVATALIRYSLSERKQDIDQLFENLQPIISEMDELNKIVNQMINDNLVEIENGFLKNKI